jgi:hypothetical protein
MLLIYRRVGILSIAVLVANFVLPIMDHHLRFVGLRQWGRCLDRRTLSLVKTRSALIAFAFDGPGFVSSMSYMYVFLGHDSYLVLQVTE